MNILILGVSGMLGSAMIRVLSEKNEWNVYGTVRSEMSKHHFHANVARRLISGVDVDQDAQLLQAFIKCRPDVVINCVGLVKQLRESNDPFSAVSINSLLPHRLARICEFAGARLIHMSTDCVFSGEKGAYVESDDSDARDLYGKSKFLGEVDYPHAVTLRTSIIGHELQSRHGLIGWFLSQEKQCRGFTRAIFSGFPTVALAQIVRDIIIPQADLYGVYHVAAKPISKYDLLRLVAEVYDKKIKIVPDDSLVIDRSLNAVRFENATGYTAPEWQELIETMHAYQ